MSEDSVEPGTVAFDHGAGGSALPASDPQSAATADTKVVLHIAREYPDANRRKTTHAVKNLVHRLRDGGENANHVVFSLARTSWPWKCNVIDGDGDGDNRVISMRYWGLPFGALLSPSMYIAMLRINRIIKERGLEFDVIHAHKLSYVGLIGYWLSKRFDKPLILSIRGCVEQKIFTYKPYYRWFMGPVLRRCERVYFVSAWYRPILNRRFSLQHDRQKLLPNFINEEKISTGDEYTTNHFVTILHLDIFRKKGLHVLLSAFANIVKETPDAKLDIIGRGTPRTFRTLRALIASLNLQDHVTLVGEIKNEEVLARMPTYAGMVLPSRRETFGMVYVEALSSGVPILYSEETGVDGYMDGIEAAVAANAYSVLSIADGLRTLIRHQHHYRAWLKDNRQMVLDRFRAKPFVKDYDAFIGSL